MKRGYVYEIQKMLMGITATVCTFSAIAPLNAHASEVEKNGKESFVGNKSVENMSFDINQVFCQKIKEQNMDQLIHLVEGPMVIIYTWTVERFEIQLMREVYLSVFIH